MKNNTLRGILVEYRMETLKVFLNEFSKLYGDVDESKISESLKQVEKRYGV